MKVTPDDYGRRCQFDHFCKLVLYHEAVDYFRERKRQRGWETSQIYVYNNSFKPYLYKLYHTISDKYISIREFLLHTQKFFKPCIYCKNKLIYILPFCQHFLQRFMMHIFLHIHPAGNAADLCDDISEYLLHTLL